jgi:hypothetical protein
MIHSTSYATTRDGRDEKLLLQGGNARDAMDMSWTIRRIVFLLLVSVSPSVAGPIFSFTGNFSADDNLQVIDFHVGSLGPVSIRTWSFAGGMNGAGQMIPDGGFAPVLSLFDSTGLLLTSDNEDSSGSCLPRVPDLASGFCWDAFLSQSLSPGSYFVVLTEDNNTPNGPGFSDGFSMQGQGNFTGPEFRGQPGSFILIDGSQRTSAWAFDISGADSAGTPEPSSGLFAAAGLAFLAALKFGRKGKQRRVMQV